MLQRLVRLAAHPQLLWHNVLIFCDYLRVRAWDNGGLARQPDAAPRGDVYIVSLSGMIYGTKLKSLLGKGLQRHGYRPVVICSRTARWPQRYFKAFGIRDFIYLDDMPVTDEEETRAELTTDEFFRGTINFPRVKTWKFDGAPIGQYALSTVARALHRGMPDLADVEVLRRLRQEMVKGIANFLRARRLVRAIARPACWLFNEMNYTDFGPLFFAAYERNENTIQFVHALRDRALVFKRITPETYRVHPNSVSRSTLEALSSRNWTHVHDEMLEHEFNARYSGRWSLYRRDQEGAVTKSADEVRTQLSLASGKKTVVVFSHILWDANLFYGDDLFDDNEHWFVETLRAACRNDRVNWIVKLHPAMKWKLALDGSTGELTEDAVIREKVGTLPPHVKLLYPTTDINTFSIIQITDIGVTIRGTIGIELASLGIPVITAGTGRYSGLGFTIDPPTRETYLDALSRAESIGPLRPDQLAAAKRYALALFCLRPWVMSAFENVHDNRIRGAHPLNPRLEIRAHDLADLNASTDLRKFAEWATASRAVDYLEPWPDSAHRGEPGRLRGASARAASPL